MILINDEPVTSLEEAKEALKMKKSFTSKFYFVQAKTSSSFDSGEMLKLGYGVKSFFEDKDLNANQRVKDFKAIADLIFENSINFQENPTCSIYYVTTGKWVNDTNLTRIVDVQTLELRSLNYFSTVEFQPVPPKRVKV